MTAYRAAGAFAAVIAVAAALPWYGSEYGVGIALSLAMWIALAQSGRCCPG